MPAYSNLGIKLIDTGAEPAVWGISTNQNLELFDSSVVGFVNVVLTTPGNSTSPNTIDVADFSASDGRNRIIQFSSSADLGASAFVQITPNDFEGYYYVKNNLSSGRTILLFQGSYNSTRRYEIPNGKDVLVRCTGTGDISSVLDVLNDLVTNSVYTGDLTTNTFSANSITADTVTASTAFSGPGTDLIGTANQLSVNTSTSSGISTNAGNISISVDNTSTAANYLSLVNGASGNRTLRVTNAVRFVPSTGQLSATSIFGSSAAAKATINNTFQVNNLVTGTLTVSGDIPTFNGTGAIDIPAGTGAERPGTPVVGMMRFSTDTGNYEVYTNSGWQNLAVGAAPAGLGVGQNWTNLTGRAFGVNYQNTTAKPISAAVVFTLSSAGTVVESYVYPYIAPTEAALAQASSNVAKVYTAVTGIGNLSIGRRCWTGVIPAGWWYKIVKGPNVSSGGITYVNNSIIATWYELR